MLSRVIKSTCLAIAALALSAAAALAEIKSEMGNIDGAVFRIDKPDNWHGGLIISNHGYSPEPRNPPSGPVSARTRIFTDQGYAVAASSYSRGGWAIEEAMKDNEKLIKYFSATYGKPNAIYAVGGALGGAITMASLELYPDVYTAGLNTCCGTLVPTIDNMSNSFDILVLTDYYFPGALPKLTGGPGKYRHGDAEAKRLQAIFDKNPQKAEIIRRYARRKPEDIAYYVAYQTYQLHEIQERSGGMPFDNTTTVYQIDGDDFAAVNAGVKRFSADPAARDYVRRWYTPTGRLTRPLFIMSPVYDPIVLPTQAYPYVTRVKDAGFEKNLVFQYYNHEGHGSMTPDEIKAAFDALQAWVKTGAKPGSGKGVTRQARAE